jgi:FixJ family two-component response regulator
MQLVAIVDDDELVRDAVKGVLDCAGFSTAVFPSAESFLQCERLPDVGCLVTDLCMPGMSGLDLHRQLLGSSHPIPAILMTGCAEEQVREQALHARISAYLAKPVQSRELLACIRLALEEWQTQQSAAEDDTRELGGTR